MKVFKIQILLFVIFKSFFENSFHLTFFSETDNVLESPVAYSYMYVQWEANTIISDELIRNLTLTFGTIGIVSLILIIDLRVSMNSESKIRYSSNTAMIDQVSALLSSVKFWQISCHLLKLFIRLP